MLISNGLVVPLTLNVPITALLLAVGLMAIHFQINFDLTPNRPCTEEQLCKARNHTVTYETAVLNMPVSIILPLLVSCPVQSVITTLKEDLSDSIFSLVFQTAVLCGSSNLFCLLSYCNANALLVHKPLNEGWGMGRGEYGICGS